MAEAEPIVDRELEPARDRVTGRCVALGLLLVVCVNTWPIYGLYVAHISQMVFSYMAMALMIPFVFLALGVNVFLRRFWPTGAFSPLEMAVVFSMGLIGAQKGHIAGGIQHVFGHLYGGRSCTASPHSSHGLVDQRHDVATGELMQIVQ